MRAFAIAILGVLLAAWMSGGRWLFGAGGELTLWYVPTIGLGYALLLLWLAQRVAIVRQRGKRCGRAVWVALALSAASAVAFGFTVPDKVDGALESLLGVLSNSQFSTEMSIALCNPLGILAFALGFASLGFALAAGREQPVEAD